MNILLFHISNRLFFNSEGVAPILETICTTYIYNSGNTRGRGMPKEIERKGKRKVQEDLVDPFLDEPTYSDFFLPENLDPYAIDGAGGNSPDGRQNHSVAKEGPRIVPGPAPTPLDAI